MNVRDAMSLLRQAAMIDPRFEPQGREHAEQMAAAWAVVLGEVTLDEALTAMTTHYRTSANRLMPVDILSRVPRIRSMPTGPQGSEYTDAELERGRNEPTG